MNSACSIPMLIKGDLIALEMEDGTTYDLPRSKRLGMVHDPTGSCVHKCTILILPYTLSNQKVKKLPKNVDEYAQNYFGNDMDLLEGTVDIPTGTWQYVGAVKRIYYGRHGSLQGPYQHPFEESVELYKLKGSTYALCLELPDKCVVNERGFVWP